ncbi:ribosome-associated toxin RatA of RatAB toxin-antitoxin module [Kitasatospora sp. MAA4]|uniref:type II toxin-antitoxin system RatA family toxin n=1 Tax=Kitasatospora sp. MAA4 TaxID=3035093 RepID=UPI00247626F7|nr:SRPBCC family protein [Kitasatospora sp. MAA4]MDH6131835.1 ribosome-associated toxin RatA of RatAB toxin-antitoxin module [Kitasatospora sp. MAA4]
MRNVHVSLGLPGTDAASAFRRVKDFARYPELVPVVRAVTVRETGESEETSDWEVYFRNGILRWTERDLFSPDTGVIAFAQLDGDFETFSGTWRVEADGPTASRVDFDADFDFGIPSLAGILDPVAERVFKETIARVVTGLFGEAVVLGDEALTRALALAPAPVAVSAVA